MRQTVAIHGNQTEMDCCCITPFFIQKLYYSWYSNFVLSGTYAYCTQWRGNYKRCSHFISGYKV